MVSTRSFWGYVLISLLRLASGATPPVNVALQASFHSPPFLLELLEAAADEDPSLYFPILDHIAQGHFDGAVTDQALYNKFVDLFTADGGLEAQPDALSSIKLALSIHNSAPRIEAQYQYYKTEIEPRVQSTLGNDCESWLLFNGKQFCSPVIEEEDAQNSVLESTRMPFDRTYWEEAQPPEHPADSEAAPPPFFPPDPLPAILYADILSPSFRQFHKTLSKTASQGMTSYTVRYKPSKSNPVRPLGISGYGVQLNLKRTDYIVIDDRQGSEDKAGEQARLTPQSQLSFLGGADDVDIEDIAPLSSSELEGIDVKASSYVINSDKPLDTLLKITQDFPKHSTFLASQNASDNFVTEHRENRQTVLPAGVSVVWLNGIQYDTRKMDPYSLLDYIRKERELVGNVKKFGLSAQEAIKLLSNDAITHANTQTESKRYDWRDETEGGGVIIWLNDLEKDSRYSKWQSSVYGLLQAGYPGQLPAVKRDIHNAIFPIDLSDTKQLATVVDTVQSIIKRGIPCRWGLVPLASTADASRQAQVVYYLLDTYGLGTVMEYLRAIQKPVVGGPVESLLAKSTDKRKLRLNREERELEAILADVDLDAKVKKASQYLRRLGVHAQAPPIFVNGVPIKRDDETWLQTLSQKVSTDLRHLQRAVFEESVGEDDWLPGYLLKDAVLRRNPLIIPEDEKQIKLFSLGKIWKDAEERHNIGHMQPQIPADPNSNKTEWTQILLATDYDTDAGLTLLQKAIEFRKKHGNVNLVVLNTGDVARDSTAKSRELVAFLPFGQAWDEFWLNELQKDLETMKTATAPSGPIGLWPNSTQLLRKFGFQEGETGIVINGRKVGPIPSDMDFNHEDFESLYQFEYTKRIQPASSAMQALGIADKLKKLVDVVDLSSLLAVSMINTEPEGIFDTPPPVRSDVFDVWKSEHTAIITGDVETASIQLIATIDPVSENAQRWVPVIKALSELDGVYTKIFMNPLERLNELPVKRFYRYVLESEPRFNGDGSIKALSANFKGMPRKTLMTMGMDVAASWLVAPKDSIYDLDNIKLSTVDVDDIVDATYELESILIEGHSRDVSGGQPPRGTQLVLSTSRDPLLADTMIMANLGYFQFKANPGYYNIKLKPGPSANIFNIDSVGALGYDPQPGDEVTDVTLMSFQGLTLYPRLSRKPGMEEEDVLAAPEKASTASEMLNKGAGAVDSLLSKAGLKNAGTGKYLSKALEKGQKLLNTVTSMPARKKQADINIFSVASGHLYERMLNIMMLSVMKHTKHTVKFWFIEQFLSPSFKSFLPLLAAEYGFDYEMVTYKWPHWLRTQKEKQREIWGYKILFLDVLFPLDLDKVIFVDADQIVRTDMYELVQLDLHGAPYGFTPMCDSRTEMEGYRFWKQGYWKQFLRGLPYHISALYVVDLKRFREIAAGDRLRGQYHQLSADPGSLSNLDQDLPNNMQMSIPIHSLPQDWLWCETWCSDEALKTAKTIDLCNNPETKEPKLDRARRQVPEWTVYDDEIAALARKHAKEGGHAVVGEGAGRVQEQDQIERDRPVPRQASEEEIMQGPEKVRDEL